MKTKSNPTKGKSFDELLEENPCEGCPAPCCRMLLTPQQIPRTIRDIDHMRYSILFEGSELAISVDGNWSLVKWQHCTLLDTKHCTCTVHSSPRQPLICKDFSPYQCWYKRNFVQGVAEPDIYRFNLERFEEWVKELGFDDSGMIISFPDLGQARKKLDKIPVEPVFKTDAQYIKSK